MQADLVETKNWTPGSVPGCSDNRSSSAKILRVFSLVGSRGSAILAQFATQLVVGALAGASGLGVLQLLTSWTCIAGEALAMGLPSRAMRQVSVAYANGQRASIDKILQHSRRKILRTWACLLVLVLPVCGFALRDTAPGDWSQYHWLLIGAFCSAPLFALLRLYAESLKSTGATLMAVTVENMTSPVIILLVCLVCWLSGQPVIALTLALAFALGLFIAQQALRISLSDRLVKMLPVGPGETDSGAAVGAGHSDLFYLWASSLLSIVFMHIPFLLMPLYISTDEIGVFALAHKLINVITTLLLLLAAIYGPAIARCAAVGDKAGQLALLYRTQVISSGIYIPTVMILIAVAPVFSTLFGEDFTGLQKTLLILSGGYLVNALTGLCGVLLNMSGAARKELAALALALAFAVSASVWTGPRFGADGLAAVFSISIAIKNIASYFMAKQLLGPSGEQQ